MVDPPQPRGARLVSSTTSPKTISITSRDPDPDPTPLLPPEIWQEVMLHLRRPTPRFKDPAPRSAILQPDLAACARVSIMFYQLATPVLYKHIITTRIASLLEGVSPSSCPAHPDIESKAELLARTKSLAIEFPRWSGQGYSSMAIPISNVLNTDARLAELFAISSSPNPRALFPALLSLSILPTFRWRSDLYRGAAPSLRLYILLVLDSSHSPALQHVSTHDAEDRLDLQLGSLLRFDHLDLVLPSPAPSLPNTTDLSFHIFLARQQTLSPGIIPRHPWLVYVHSAHDSGDDKDAHALRFARVVTSSRELSKRRTTPTDNLRALPRLKNVSTTIIVVMKVRFERDRTAVFDPTLALALKAPEMRLQECRALVEWRYSDDFLIFARPEVVWME